MQVESWRTPNISGKRSKMKRIMFSCIFILIIVSNLFSQNFAANSNQNYSFKESSTFPGVNLSDIAFDRDGNPWIISSKTDNTQKRSPLSSNIPMIYYVSKYQNGLYYTIQDSLKYPIEKISFDYSNNLWILAYKQIIRVDGKSKFEIVYELGDKGLFNSLNFDCENNVWVGGLQTGFLIFDGTSWTNYNTENSTLPTNSLTNIYIDKNNIKWMTLWEQKGILKIENKQWSYYNQKDSELLNQNFWDINKDSENNLWVGTGFSYPSVTLIKFDGKKWIENNPKNNKGDSVLGTVRNIITDCNGNVWALSSKSNNRKLEKRILTKFDGKKWSTIDVDKSIIINDIELDLDGNLWIVTPRFFYKLGD
jgi:ligand-binding sensor domain-containing protein